MPESITVTLPTEIKTALDDLTRKEGISTDALISRAVKEHLFLRRFRTLRERMAFNATAQGIHNDEDVFNRVS